MCAHCVFSFFNMLQKNSNIYLQFMNVKCSILSAERVIQLKDRQILFYAKYVTQ